MSDIQMGAFKGETPRGAKLREIEESEFKNKNGDDQTKIGEGNANNNPDEEAYQSNFLKDGNASNSKKRRRQGRNLHEILSNAPRFAQFK
jgi:hypothetical protein